MTTGMRVSTFLPVLGLAGQALAAAHSCVTKLPGSGIPSDKAVEAYFDKLAPTTKKTLLHDTTGPEAGADVRLLFYYSLNRVLHGTHVHTLRSVSSRPSSRIPTIPNFRSTGCAMLASSITPG